MKSPPHRLFLALAGNVAHVGLIKHRPGAKMADTQEFLKKLREERGVTKIGGVG